MDGRKSLTKQFKKMSRTEDMFRYRDKAENRPPSLGAEGQVGATGSRRRSTVPKSPQWCGGRESSELTVSPQFWREVIAAGTPPAATPPARTAPATSGVILPDNCIQTRTRPHSSTSESCCKDAVKDSVLCRDVHSSALFLPAMRAPFHARCDLLSRHCDGLVTCLGVSALPGNCAGIVHEQVPGSLWEHLSKTEAQKRNSQCACSQCWQVLPSRRVDPVPHTHAGARGRSGQPCKPEIAAVSSVGQSGSQPPKKGADVSFPDHL